MNTSFISAHDSGFIRLGDILTGSFVTTIPAHKEPVTMIDWNPLKEYEIVSCSKDRTAKVWDLRKLGGLTKPLFVLSDERNGSSFASSSSSSQALPKAHSSEVMSIRYTPCGNYLLTVGNDQELKLWNINNGRKVRKKTYQIRPKKSSLPYRIEMIPSFFSSPFSYNASSSAVRKDSSFLLPVDSQVALVPILNGTVTPSQTLAGHFDQVTSVVYRPIRNEIVSCARDGLLLLWDCSQYYHHRDKEKIIGEDERKEVQAEVSSEARKETTEEIARSLLRYYPVRNSVSSNSSSVSLSPSSSSMTSTSSNSLKMDPIFLSPMIQHYLSDISLNDIDLTLFDSLSSSSSSSSSSLHSSVFSSSGFLPSQRISAAELDWNNIETFLKLDDVKSEVVDSIKKGNSSALSTIPDVMDNKKKKKKQKNVREDINKILKRTRY
jgi:hypothetical protein